MSNKSPSSIGSGRSPNMMPDRASMKRLQGRITKDDIRSAGLRRWNGRSRVTTDWVNLYQEPELCFPSGDLLVYLRQTGQSSRGPAFRIHSSHLQARGFHFLLKQCIAGPALDTSRRCLQNSCPGCDKHESAAELYIPAPPLSGMDATFDHHITTRNFFAWLYDMPLAGRSLGLSLVALKSRIDTYRGGPSALTDEELVTYADSQKYLDFRECVDHALAAMTLAEVLHKEDLWSDAFAHAVGMSHRDINASIEYSPLSSTTKRLLLESRLEMDVRLARASLSIETFFGDDLSGNFLGFHHAAREHFDRFRSFLHAFYIEKYGFWPPAGFSNESTRYSIYTAIYSDFRNLYHHLVDAQSSSLAADLANTGTGGVCTLQNIRAFDAKHGFETLPKPLPCLPVEPSSTVRTPVLQRRRSWNPMMQKKIERECRNNLRVQALIDASNRDMTIMECPIVRRYSEFESQSILDDLEQVSWIDGRKVRWVLVYAILQTLISIMAAPKAVRNTDRLSYPLCCRVPTKLPWQKAARSSDRAEKAKELVPDINYINKNSSTSALDLRPSRSTTRKERRQSIQSLPQSPVTRSMSMPRATSLRRLLSRKRTAIDEPTPPVPSITTSFCEILVQGYGNGLNEVVSGKSNSSTVTIPIPEKSWKRQTMVNEVEVKQRRYSEIKDATRTQEAHDVPDLSSTSVSRESSNRSCNSVWSKSSSGSMDELQTPVDIDKISQLADMLKSANMKTPTAHVQVYEEIDFEGSIHINTKTWDEILG